MFMSICYDTWIPSFSHSLLYLMLSSKLTPMFLGISVSITPLEKEWQLLATDRLTSNGTILPEIRPDQLQHALITLLSLKHCSYTSPQSESFIIFYKSNVLQINYYQNREIYAGISKENIFHSPKSSKRIHSCLCHHGPISIFQSHSLHISTSRLKQKISASNPVIHVGCVAKKEWHRPVSNKPPKILEPMINSQAQKS